MPAPRRIEVVLAVIERRGRVLICKRRTDDFLGGYWEFPGGKREPGETWLACVRRELREELGIAVVGIRWFSDLRYRYGAREIRFKVFRCRIRQGRPRPLDAQAVRWIPIRRLSRYRFPPANRPLTIRLTADAGVPKKVASRPSSWYNKK